ncbi:MAG: hypothetical protein ACE5D0_00210 [Fidelibacterota bacterium]
MKKQKHIYKCLGLIHLLILGLFVSSMWAESYWVKYGWQSFKNAGDAQSIALGQALTAAYSGAASVLQNPAHAHHSYNQYLYAHQNRFAGLVNSDFLAFPTLAGFQRPVNVVLFHEGVSNIPDTRTVLLDWGIDGIPGTGDAGESNGHLDEGERLDATQVSFFKQSQWGIHLSTTWKVKNWILGVGMKGLFHSLAEHYASGIGFDLGATRSFWKGNTIGLTLTNATTSWLVWENGTIERFSPEFYAGISQEIGFEQFPLTINLMADAALNPFSHGLEDDFQFGETGGRYRGGLGIRYKKFTLRFGRGLNALTSAGLGLDWGQAAIHYAFTTGANSTFLGDSHLLSFSLEPKWLAGQLGKIL